MGWKTATKQLNKLGKAQQAFAWWKHIIGKVIESYWMHLNTNYANLRLGKAQGFRLITNLYVHTHPVSWTWLRYMSAMSSSLSSTSVRVDSISLTKLSNSERLLDWCRRMCSWPLSTEKSRGSSRLFSTSLRAGSSSERLSSSRENWGQSEWVCVQLIQASPTIFMSMASRALNSNGRGSLWVNVSFSCHEWGETQYTMIRTHTKYL